MRAPLPSVERVSPAVLVFGGIGSLQLGAALATTLFAELGPSGATLLRLGLAAVVLAAIWRPDPRAYTAAQLRLAAAFGVVLGVMNLTFYQALDRLPLGVAVTIEFVGPLGVAVATSRRRADLAWAAVAAAGIVLLADPGGGTIDPVGVAFVLVAGACWAGYILLAQAAGPSFAGGNGIALATAVAAAVVLVPGVVGGGAALGHLSVLPVALAVALLSSAIPYSLEFEALRRMPANVFGVLMSLEPGVAAIIGLVVLGQALALHQVLAIGLVVAASVGVTRAGRRAEGLAVNS